MFVIGGRVIARDAPRRAAATGGRTWRRAAGRNASTLTRARRNARAAAAEAVGCPVAGVDLLPGPRGELYVIEVNAVPGWRALAPTCGVDVATESRAVRHAGDTVMGRYDRSGLRPRSARPACGKSCAESWERPPGVPLHGYYVH